MDNPIVFYPIMWLLYLCGEVTTFFMQTINITVPRGWHELTQRQLRYLFFLISEGYSSTAIKTLCLFRWSGLRVISRKQGQFYLRLNKSPCSVSSTRIAFCVHPQPCRSVPTGGSLRQACPRPSSNTDYGRTTAQDEKYHASRERCQIHLNTAEEKLVLGKAKFREETVATSDTKRSEVAAVGSRVSIMPP